MPGPDTDVLKTIIEALRPLTSEERRRTLDAALAFLSEAQPDAAATERNSETRDAKNAAGGDLSETTRPEQAKR
jgi:hypothetical protein